MQDKFSMDPKQKDQIIKTMVEYAVLLYGEGDKQSKISQANNLGKAPLVDQLRYITSLSKGRGDLQNIIKFVENIITQGIGSKPYYTENQRQLLELVTTEVAAIRNPHLQVAIDIAAGNKVKVGENQTNISSMLTSLAAEKGAFPSR